MQSIYGQTYEVEEVVLTATIMHIEGLPKSETHLCPIVIGEEIFFTSSRENYSSNSKKALTKENTYMNLFQADIEMLSDTSIHVNSIRLLSKKIQTKNHTGPMSFSISGDTLFYAQIQKESERKPYKSQLYYAVKKKNKWGKITKLPFCELTESYVHPAYDSRNNRLYFSAELKNGAGGKDIYYSELQNGQWSAPVNLIDINTAADEKFPNIIGGNIFFSSDRGNGVGNLDIYYAALENAYFPIKIRGLNTPFDDYGVTISSDLNSGYFTSNRDGNDNIYYFKLEKSVRIKSQLAGNFQFRKVGGQPENLRIKILDEHGTFVYEQRTDKYGNFLFDDVLLNNNYRFQLDSTNQDDLVLEFYNENGKVIANFIVDRNGDFQYKKLFYEEGGIIKFIPDNMKEITTKKAKLSGKLLYEDNPIKSLSKGIVNLVDSNRRILITTVTDNYGNFEIPNLDIEVDYFIEVPLCSEELIVYIYDVNEHVFTQLKCNTQDHFMYRLLKPHAKNKLSLIAEKQAIFVLDNADIFGRLEPEVPGITIERIIIEAYSQDGKLLDIDTTDKKGNFRFSGLEVNQQLKFKTTNGELIILKLFDRFGKTIAQIQAEEGSYFSYRPVGFKPEGQVELLDNKNQFSLDAIKKYGAVLLYFDSNDSRVKKTDLHKLNDLIDLMQKHPIIYLSVSAYTDATASDEYNLLLSEKRGIWIAEYLVGKGISVDRITVNAYGETKLIDNTNDALNRRAELRIYKKED